MIIRIKKNADGRTSLTCTRADGTTTWQSLNGATAQFFPRHDLTHYAVETVLAGLRGFYALVAGGWDLTDFGSPWPRGRIPMDASLSEMIVGYLDLERRTGAVAQIDDINSQLAAYCAEHGFPSPEPITESDLDRIRRKRAELFSQWEAVKPGDALELPF
jgi:hypothetical protein